jgi:hypothetical protein
VNRDELRSALIGGTVAASATAGTLIGLGRRDATSWYAFNVASSHLVGPRAAALFGFVFPDTILGLVVHLIVVLALSVLLLHLVRRQHLPLWATAASISLLAALISIGLARRGSPSLAGVLPIGDLVIYHIVLAVALGVGIRFALPRAAAQ